MSLIEVLVVMLILVIGIFTVATVFPQGFRFIEHSRNVTLAGRLCQAEVERWKAYAANVPDGIEAMNAVDGSIRTNYNPDDMSNADPTDPMQGPAGAPLWLWSNVNRVRQVKGEVTRIPSATILPYGTGGNYAFSLYSLKMAPIVFSPDGQGNHPKPAGTVWPDQYVLIYGDPQPSKDVTGLTGEELNAALDNLDQQTYGIDYPSGKLYFQSTQFDRKFKVDYSYWDGGVLKNSMEIVTIPANAADPVTIQLGRSPVDDFSERVSRKFDYVAPGAFDRFNPYEFTVLNSYEATSFAPTIGFNPIGQNRTVRTNLGSRPLTAHIDYEVLDWHVIHEERTVPNPVSVDPNGYVIRLTLPGIKVAGRRQNDINVIGANGGTVNQALYSGLTPDLAGVSVVGLDMTDNTLMMDNSAGGLIVDYTNGFVRVPAAVTKYTPFGGDLKNQDIRGHDVRFFYQATGDWAVQVSKAWFNYQRRDVGRLNLANLQYNNFDVEIVQPGDGISQIGYSNITSDVCAVLIFPRSNAGHAIAASMIWNDVDNVPHEITGHQDKLPEFAMLSPLSYPYMAIRLAPPARFQPNNAAAESWKNPYFTFVQGASLKVRTIWREDPRRWESRDMETFLNRK